MCKWAPHPSVEVCAYRGEQREGGWRGEGGQKRPPQAAPAQPDPATPSRTPNSGFDGAHSYSKHAEENKALCRRTSCTNFNISCPHSRCPRLAHVAKRVFWGDQAMQAFLSLLSSCIVYGSCRVLPVLVIVVLYYWHALENHFLCIQDNVLL